jgi:membrane dipeptidase
MTAIDRRKFLISSGNGLLAATVASLAPCYLAAASAEDLNAAYANAIIIDTLCAPVNAERFPISQKSLDDARQSGITAVNFTVSEPSFEDTVSRVAFARALADRYPSNFLIVTQHSDIVRAKQENKIGILLGFQHASCFDSDLARLETFRNLGVRIMQLSYNKRSLLGDGCLEPDNLGLSSAGRKAVATMNELGIAVDLSHSGQTTTRDAIAASKKPILISHAGCAAIHAHPRNKDDETLRQLVQRGGYFGVYLMPYLSASPNVPTKEDVLNHLERAINICGADHVGIGSDGSIQSLELTDDQRKAFAEDMAQRKKSGIAAPEEDRLPYVPELSSCMRMREIAEALRKRNVPWATVEKILGANFQRTIAEIWS